MRLPNDLTDNYVYHKNFSDWNHFMLTNIAITILSKGLDNTVCQYTMYIVSIQFLSKCYTFAHWVWIDWKYTFEKFISSYNYINKVNELAQEKQITKWGFHNNHKEINKKTAEIYRVWCQTLSQEIILSFSFFAWFQQNMYPVPVGINLTSRLLDSVLELTLLYVKQVTSRVNTWN